MKHSAFLASSAALLVLVASLSAAPLTLTVRTPGRPAPVVFHLGEARDPHGHVLSADPVSLRRDGQPWLPVMGEFHYARYPAAEWREELLKMKAARVDIVSTYVFWIHHEEVEGRWDWSGVRDLRAFVETARDVGLDVVVRCGPWCHGEVRNGGLPDWVVAHKDWKLRSTDAAFLAATRELYAQIATQLRGLLWKDGGPVIGIQLDNEYRGPAEYLLALKRLARECGLDVPLYTRTGWPALTTPMPVGEILPLYGAYAEGFWDRELTSMPGKYWQAFRFSTQRGDAAIATEMLGQRVAPDDPDAAAYPYLTCEVGGGMMSSYHRRILIDPRDVEATTLVKIAGGSTLPGYYMFHGGTNPDGVRTTLMEAQDTPTTNYNDLPVKTYDFQAPLGEFGEVRPQYHRLRRLHLFLNGADLTHLAPALPDVRPAGRDDVTTLRWGARSDGRRGVLFISNYERGRTLPPKEAVQLHVALADGSTVTLPSAPVTIPTGTLCWWPFNTNLGGVTLEYATAEPVTHVLDGNGMRTLFFAAVPGVPTEFAFPADQVAKLESAGRVATDGGRVLVRDVPSGHDVALRLQGKSGAVIQIVVFDDADSLRLWKGPFAGRQRAVLTATDVVFEAGRVRVTPTAAGGQTVAFFPAPGAVRLGGVSLVGEPDGVFTRYRLPPGYFARDLAIERVRAAGPLREIRLGPGRQGVAMEPTDADFAAAAVWRVAVPVVEPGRQAWLRLFYVGDVARLSAGGRLLTDDFYNGNPRSFGVWRVPPGTRELECAILPLQKHAPIFLADSAKPEFGDANAVVRLERVACVEVANFTLTGMPEPEPSLPQNFRTDRAFRR